MTREDKENIVEKLTTKFRENNHYYMMDASGLTVAEVNKLRRLCFELNVEYGVYKNTLIKKALEKQENINEDIFTSLKGFTGVLFAKEVGKDPAQIVKTYRKDIKDKFFLKVASVDSNLYFGEDSLDILNNIKSKEELIGDVISLLQYPLKNVLSGLDSNDKLIGMVKALENKK